jgi:hypothetical protein
VVDVTTRPPATERRVLVVVNTRRDSVAALELKRVGGERYVG